MESTAESTGAGIGANSLIKANVNTREICGITFTEKSKLISHFFGHEKENQYRFFKFAYECDECLENFALKEDLLEHMLCIRHVSEHRTSGNWTRYHKGLETNGLVCLP